MTRAVREAERQLAKGRIDDAVRTLTKALVRDKNDPAVRAALARTAILLGRPEDANRLLDGVEGAPALACAVAIACGDNNRALAVTDGVTDPDALRWRGYALFAEGRHDDACEALRNAVATRSDDADLQHALGLFERAAGRPGPAVDAFKAALEIDLARLDTSAALVDLLCFVDRTDAARDVARVAVQTAPDEVAAWRIFSAVALRRGDSAEVVYGLSEIVRIEPSERHCLDLATFALSANDVETAIRTVDFLLASHPNSAEGRRLRAMLLDAADRLDEAITDLRLAAARAPDDWRPLNDLGCLLNTRRDPEAHAVLTRAVALAPDEVAPGYNLVLACLNANRREDAQRGARALLSKFAEDPLARSLAKIAQAPSRRGS